MGHLPKQCRRVVPQLAHTVPSGGQLGKKKMTARVLIWLYWPTLHRDVADFCWRCEQCQMFSHKRSFGCCWIERLCALLVHSVHYIWWLTRWSLPLQPYQFTVKYCTGTMTGNADSLSRLPKDDDKVAGEGGRSVVEQTN